VIDTKVDVHLVCCDANIALCGTALSGGDRYSDSTNPVSCLLCRLADELGQPCGAPGCDVGRDPFEADLEFALLDQCRVCGCTDDTACPGGCQWVEDPHRRGALCSACLPSVSPTAGAQHG
jgi:hypothetical protein